MKVTTLRLPERLYRELNEEAEQRGLSFSEYARRVFQDHADSGGVEKLTDDEIRDRFERLERAVGVGPDRRDLPDVDETTTDGANGSRATPNDDRNPKGRTRENTTPDRPEFANMDFPAGRDQDECIRAIGAAREFVDENGGASMREIVANVMPEHPVGYDVPDLEPGDRYRGSWWRKIVRPGLEAFEDVEKPRGGGEWSVRSEATVYDPTQEFE